MSSLQDSCSWEKTRRVPTCLSAVFVRADELNSVRQALYQLGNQHRKVRQQYEGGIRSLGPELNGFR